MTTTPLPFHPPGNPAIVQRAGQPSDGRQTIDDADRSSAERFEQMLRAAERSERPERPAPSDRSPSSRTDNDPAFEPSRADRNDGSDRRVRDDRNDRRADDRDHAVDRQNDRARDDDDRTARSDGADSRDRHDRNDDRADEATTGSNDDGRADGADHDGGDDVATGDGGQAGEGDGASDGTVTAATGPLKTAEIPAGAEQATTTEASAAVEPVEAGAGDGGTENPAAVSGATTGGQEQTAHGDETGSSNQRLVVAAAPIVDGRSAAADGTGQTPDGAVADVQVPGGSDRQTSAQTGSYQGSGQADAAVLEAATDATATDQGTDGEGGDQASARTAEPAETASVETAASQTEATGDGPDMAMIAPSEGRSAEQATTAQSGLRVDATTGPQRAEGGQQPTTTAEVVDGSGADEPLWRQVRRAIGSLRQTGTGEQQLTIRLRPAELGSVMVRIVTGDNGTAIALVADSAAAASQLGQQRQQLINELEDGGLRGVAVDVGTSEGENDQTGAPGDEDDRSDGGSTDGINGDRNQRDPAVSYRSARVRSAPAGLVDLDL